MTEQFYPVVNQLVSILSTKALLNSKNIKKFIQTVNDLLKMNLDIQVSQMDTSRDTLFASIIAYCDDPEFNRNQILQLGYQLHFSEQDLQALDGNSLCEKLKSSFKF